MSCGLKNADIVKIIVKGTLANVFFNFVIREYFFMK